MLSIHTDQPRTKLLALIGQPVERSLSPRFQNAALEAAGLDAIYLALPVAPADLRQAAEGMNMGAVFGTHAFGFSRS